MAVSISHPPQENSNADDHLTASETQSFLHDPLQQIDTFYSSDEFQPYKDNTGRQLRHILAAGLARWAITALMCAAYAAATIIWQHKPAQGETSKRLVRNPTIKKMRLLIVYSITRSPRVLVSHWV
jgi:hypothetical protein